MQSRHSGSAGVAERSPDGFDTEFSREDRLRLAVIVASTRPGRAAPFVANWFEAQAQQFGRFEVEMIDLAELALPLFDEPAHPRLRQYGNEHTKRWSETVARADAFVIITPEYDHVPPAALTNALQYLMQEWAYKPAGFVSYGGVSAGLRGVQQTKLLLNALRMVPVLEAVSIPFFAQHIDREKGSFEPGETQEKAAQAMLAELHKLATALRPLHTPIHLERQTTHATR